MFSDQNSLGLLSRRAIGHNNVGLREISLDNWEELKSHSSTYGVGKTQNEYGKRDRDRHVSVM